MSRKSLVVWLRLLGMVLFVLASMSCTAPSDGLNGPKGDKGDPGLAPDISMMPATVQQCPNGGLQVSVTLAVKSGDVVTHDTTINYVCNGENGLPGQSIVGPKGDTGTPGTVIVPIQFCAGFTPSYPNTFAEFGLRIGTSVYGVYSENGGFLVYMPPGRYHSHGINADCNFTLNSDGSIYP